MKTNLVFGFIFLWLFHLSVFSQQLVINEVSQGPTGAQEYVELVVSGTPSCSIIPCMDLRNYIIDDNNGNHASGSGTGIAAGCIKLKNISFWSCIPIGTLILFYNDADLNPLIPAQDLSMTDGNCKLVIPISDCSLIEQHATLPSASSSTYPNTAYSNCGLWSVISMANGDDSFQTITPSGNLVHSVSWGNNTLSTIIYFGGSAGGKVAVMNNSADNNPANQLNWTFMNVVGNETPGNPNNTANASWINSMNNSCSPLVPFTTTLISNNTGACLCNASATLNTSGGIAPYTYSWLPIGGNAAIATGLCSGIYTVNSTSSNGCTQSKTLSIGSSSSVSLSIINNSITCNGLANGTATVIAAGGVPPYSYTWSPSGGNGAIANGLSVGVYSVFVADANNCATTITTAITQPLAPITAIVSTTNNLCFGATNGAINVIVNGGNPSYSYSWSPMVSNSNSANGLQAGVYSILVKDFNNCSATATAIITQPLTTLGTIISVTNNLCYGGSTGSANVIVTGGSPSYSYSWSPMGGNSNFANSLPAGSYSVIVKDNNNCTTIATLAVTQPSIPLSAFISFTNSSCFGSSTGAASVNAIGGTPAYSYTWSSNGVNTAFVNGLSLGTCSVIVKDANNCLVTASVAITQPTSAINALIASKNVTCFGGTNGSATVTAFGGTPGYSYSWNSLGQTTPIINNLSANNYSVIIKDANNCSKTITLNINEPLPFTLSVNSITLCNGQSGIMSANLSGGVAPFIYNWNGNSSPSNTLLIPGATSTVINVSVTDVNGCTTPSQSAHITLATPLNLAVNSEFSVCAGSQISLNASASGGNGNYNFVWQPGGLIGSVQVIPNVTTSKLMTVSVTDGCFSTTSKTLNLISYPVPSSSITSTKNTGCEPLCVAFSNTPLFLSGLVQSYQWNFGNNTSSNSSPYNCFDKAGDYSVSLDYTTINGCKGKEVISNYIHVNPSSQANFSSDKLEIDDFNMSVNFTNQSINTSEFNWFFGNEGSSIEKENSFTFSKNENQVVVLATNNEFGCRDTAIKEIKFKSEFTFFAPNTFSPNNDNLNDVFLPNGIGWNKNKFELRVYNRWGEKIFFTKRFDEGWDGILHGTMVPNDVYVWKVNLDDLFSKHHEFVGHIMVESN